MMKHRTFTVLATALVMGFGMKLSADEAEHGEAHAKPLARSLATTRAHVLPAGEIEFEQWWRVSSPRSGSASHQFLTEVEAGLPLRFHLALYEVSEITASDTFRHRSFDVELRWALAEYGALLLNPTLYGEWKFVDEGADKYELKLLLAEDLTEEIWWAFNLVLEQEVGGSREQELGVTQALMYKIDGRRLAAGVELKYLYVTENGSRGEPAHEFLIGPSVLWKIHDRVKVKAAPLFGVTGDSPQIQAFVVIEIELWEPNEH